MAVGSATTADSMIGGTTTFEMTGSATTVVVSIYETSGATTSTSAAVTGTTSTGVTGTTSRGTVGDVIADPPR